MSLVAEQLLHGAQIDPGHHEAAGEAVAQIMPAEVRDTGPADRRGGRRGSRTSARRGASRRCRSGRPTGSSDKRGVVTVEGSASVTTTVTLSRSCGVVMTWKCRCSVVECRSCRSGRATPGRVAPLYDDGDPSQQRRRVKPIHDAGLLLCLHCIVPQHEGVTARSGPRCRSRDRPHGAGRAGQNASRGSGLAGCLADGRTGGDELRAAPCPVVA